MEGELLAVVFIFIPDADEFIPKAEESMRASPQRRALRLGERGGWMFSVRKQALPIARTSVVVGLGWDG